MCPPGAFCWALSLEHPGLQMAKGTDHGLRVPTEDTALSRNPWGQGGLSGGGSLGKQDLLVKMAWAEGAKWQVQEGSVGLVRKAGTGPPRVEPCMLGGGPGFPLRAALGPEGSGEAQWRSQGTWAEGL